MANSQYSLVKHPTHGDYDEYKDEGNYPENLEDWEINQLSIPVVNSVNPEFVKTQIKTHDELKLTETIFMNPVKPDSIQDGSSGFNPGSQTEETTQKTARKGGSSEKLGLTEGKTSELINMKGSEFLHEPSLTQDEASLIIMNNHEPVSTVIKKIWGLSPSRSSEYLNRKAQVEAMRKQPKVV